MVVKWLVDEERKLTEAEKELEPNVLGAAINKFFTEVEQRFKERGLEIQISVIHGNQGRLFKIANGESYFNSSVTIKNNKGVYLSNFSLTCMPNCCGVGIITTNYSRLASEEFLPEDPKFNNMIFSVKLIKFLGEYYGFPTLIHTCNCLKNYETEFFAQNTQYGVFIKEGFKDILTSKRRFRKTDESSYLKTICIELPNEKGASDYKRELFNYIDQLTIKK